MTAKKDTEMKKTKIEIKIPKNIVFRGDYCMMECDFYSGIDIATYDVSKCYLFRRYIKLEYNKRGLIRPIRCKECKNKYKINEE